MHSEAILGMVFMDCDPRPLRSIKNKNSLKIKLIIFVLSVTSLYAINEL